MCNRFNIIMNRNTCMRTRARIFYLCSPFINLLSLHSIIQFEATTDLERLTEPNIDIIASKFKNQTL